MKFGHCYSPFPSRTWPSLQCLASQKAVLVQVTDTALAANSRTYVNDALGQVLLGNQGGQIQRELIVGGQVLARYGQVIDAQQPKDSAGNPRFLTVGDFNFGFQSIGPGTGNTPAGYVVSAGDSLQGIAQTLYGDSSLWYLIADANGLAGNQDLQPGLRLSLPSLVSGTHNSATTFKPYDSSSVVGDLTPYMPTPPAKSSGGCGGIGLLLMVVVAVVATVLTAGAAAMAMGATGSGLAGAWAAGTAVMTTGAVAGVGAAGVLASAAIGAAVGSIASQGVGIAIGVQDKFSWAQVGLAALGGAISAGLSGANLVSGGAQGFGNVVARAAVGNAISQGIGVATGLQEHFQWSGVAAAALGAGVGDIVGGALKDNNAFASSLGDFAPIARATLTGMASGLSTSLAKGGRVSAIQIATDAFGNALGNAFVEQMGKTGQQAEALQQAELTTGDFSRRDGANYRSAPYVEPGAAWAADVAARRSRLNPYSYDVSAVDTAAADDLQAAFRKSERDYRRMTERSVQGRAYRAQSDDMISSMVGSSKPQAIGNFMRANGMTSDVIQRGQNYFIPDSWQAYGDQSAAGQWALNAGNDRMERAAAATAAEVANRQRWDAIQVGAWSGRTNQVSTSFPSDPASTNFVAPYDEFGLFTMPGSGPIWNSVVNPIAVGMTANREIKLGAALYAGIGGNVEFTVNFSPVGQKTFELTEFEAGVGVGLGFKVKAGLGALNESDPNATIPFKPFSPFGSGQAENTGAVSSKFGIEGAVPLFTLTGIEAKLGLQSPITGVAKTANNFGGFYEAKYLEPKFSPLSNIGLSIKWDLFNTSYKRSSGSQK